MTPIHGNVLPGILLACMPKSGSSSLSDLLARHRAVRISWLVPGWDIREQEIDFKILDQEISKNLGSTFVAQTHVVFSETTRKIIAGNFLCPIVQTRNFPDAIISAADHHLVAGHPSERIILPEDFLNWEDDRRYDYMICFMLPWYLKFFKSWLRYENFAAAWVRYEDFSRDNLATLRQVVAQLGLDPSDPSLQEKQDPGERLTRRRFNKGVSGRGRENLTARQWQRIEEMVALFEIPAPWLGYVLEGDAEAALKGGAALARAI